MRVLLASVTDVHDVRSWSGTPSAMHKALLGAGLDVVLASPLRERFGLPMKAAQLARNTLGRSEWSRLREPLLANGYAAQIRRAVAEHSPDLVLAPGTMEVARLRVDVPVITWTDATFAGLVDFYDSYTGLSPRYLRMGHAMERSALARVSLAVYSSAWAARSAVTDYGVPEDKVAVVPFGANLPDPGPVASPGGAICRLLLVGRGWERKGVDLAIATTARLRALGVPAELDVVGSSAPPGVAVPKFVTMHGALEKVDANEARQLAELYTRAAFFVLPTRADCTPVVLAEAQAHGIPVVTSDVGGTASLIRPGASGWVLGLDGFADEAAALIAAAWGSAGYAALRAEARAFYESALNWPTSAQALLGVLARRDVAGRAPASR